MLKLTLYRIHPYTISVLQDARNKGRLDPFTYYWCNKCTQCVLVNKNIIHWKLDRKSGHPQRGCETSPLPTLIRSRLHRVFWFFTWCTINIIKVWKSKQSIYWNIKRNCQGELKKYFFFILTNDVQNGR